MAEGGARRRWRRWALWSVTVALAGYALLDDDTGSRAPVERAPAPPEDGKLRVLELSPVEAHPGDALFVRVSGASEEVPLHVLISDARTSKKIEAEILHQKHEQLVVQLPGGFATGTAKLRVLQGDRTTKPFEFRVERTQRRKQVRNVIGGLALLVFGLRMLSQGLRSWAGHRMRGVLGRLTGASPYAVGLGAAVGLVTQLTTTASGLIVGLLEPRLVSLPAAIAVLIGAQLGAAATVAVLPLASAREGLMVVAIGVAWISFAVDRRNTAFGNAILGAGLLFFGLHLLRVGFEPMLADPQVLPYVRHLQSEGIPGFVACGASGVVLAALLQGPAPVFGLVLGLVQAAGVLDLRHALAVLAGTGLGAAIDTAVVAWPFDRDARRLAVAHLLFGALATFLILASVPVWAWLADVVVPGDPAEVAYGKKVFLPNVDAHLAVGFVVSQAVAALAAAIALPWWLRAARRAIPPRAEQRPALLFLLAGAGAGAEGTAVLGRRALSRALRHERAALEETLLLCRTGDRDHGSKSEHSLQDARAEVEDMFPNLVGGRQREEVTGLRRTALAVLQMQRSIEDLLRLAERGLERHFALEQADETALRPVHALVLEGLAELIEALDRGEAPDLERARAREITLNAREAAGRQDLLAAVDLEERAVPARLRVTELFDAYENVGNHLYRVCDSLTGDVE
jgi:Na+/phosphate symporter